METQSQYKKIKKERINVEKRQSCQSEENFLFGETPIEECKFYTYLGTVISSKGKFKANIKQLCKTASRAMYTLLSHTNKYLRGISNYLWIHLTR